MSTTNPVSGTSSNSLTAGLANTPANQQINQTQFLQIITEQLKDQNPLSPTDANQFVTELEGMSQVSAMQNMQSSMQASSVMSGASLIGHSILAPGSTAVLAAGGGIGGAVTAPPGTSQLTVSIQDSKGTTVNSFNVSPADSGLTSFVWNGKNSDGTAAAAGTYTVGVSATVNGASQPVSPNVVNKVDSVLIDPSTNAVDVETDTGNTIGLSQIISIM
jgi:flagellar basal-body rod modification protein FlgD